MPAKKIVGATLTKQTIDTLETLFHRPGTGATVLLEAFPGLYHQTLEELRGSFSTEELQLFLALIDPGTRLTQGNIGVVATSLIRMNLRAAATTARTLKIKLSDIMATLDCLSAFQKICLDIWITQFFTAGWFNAGEYAKTLTIEED